ncbi:MAG: DUF975 family protein [Fibrobacter sp.]|uniref:DUF975 family protein n=1 Tax=Fibrobacter sp. TaxID=35828 RepID=UPI0025C4E84B|nr:DUF975 family protein [Fibrobacter sp.]MBQ7079746.1 DUF975 family protein [Fibrobacter sp.]
MNALDTAQIKQTAWEKLGGKWAPAGFVCLIYILATIIIDVPSHFFEENSAGQDAWEIVEFIFNFILDMGLVAYFYDVVLGRELFYKRLFVGFTSGIEFALRLFFTQFFTFFFIVLWSFLLIVPGIMRAYSYGVALYVLLDNPKYSPFEALKKSKEMMFGHRLELFVLELRFIPWLLLGFITLGIGFIWIIPYFMTAYSEFYLQLKEKQA